jgi:hypothetical protein
MTKALTDAQIEQYRRDGFTFPVAALDSDEVSIYRAEIEAYEATLGHPLKQPERGKSYLLFNWADQLVHHPRVLDAVEDLIGPDILVYHTTLWTKEPHSGAHVRWHQDGTYFYLEPRLHVTAWVALSDVPVEAGCIHVIPGSHTQGDFTHDDDPNPDNMILRGQGISDAFDAEQGVPMPLSAGQISLHHTSLVHCSRANEYHDRRIGFGISYIPTSVEDVGHPNASALLVRGEDRFACHCPNPSPGPAEAGTTSPNHSELS